MIDKSLTVQLCLFCGMPNQVKKNIEEIKNIK